MPFREQAGERKLRAQLEALNEATIVLASESSLDRVLQRITDLARELAGARYAALGVPDAHGSGLEQFVFSGLTAEEAKRIGHPPQGRGLLGLLLREPYPIRVPDITADPRSYGVPPYHPPMHSFLGVPLILRGKLLGNLYLTDKIDAPEFDEDDERLIGMLAVHAAIAVDKARLMQEAIEHGRQLAQRNLDLEALNAATTAAAQSLDLDSLLSNILSQIVSVLRADAGEVFLRDETSGDLILAAHLGESRQAFYSRNRLEVGEGIPGLAAQTGEVLISEDIHHDPRFIREEVVQAGFRSFAGIPLMVKSQVIGVLTLAARRTHAFAERNIQMMAAMGQQLGVAVENARLYREVGRLAVVEERARIGMELHDGIIQSIYAVGLTMEYALLVLEEQPDVTRERLGQAIQGLNDVIRDIRAYILDMRPQRFEGKDLAAGLTELARAFRANTFINIETNIDREAGLQAAPDISDGLFHIAQEGLANIAKHARARNVGLSLKHDDGWLILELKDDGRGFDVQKVNRYAGHGMRNMEERTRLLNGQWRLESWPHLGTRIEVRIPFSSTE